MLARLSSAALLGIDAYRVDVEVDVAPGLPGFQVVGLPHGAVREGRDRVLSALAHIDRAVPPRRIVVNLAPADVPKEGSAFDLPIALGLLAAAGAVPVASLADTVFVAELGLDGSLRPVRGALSVALLCVDERVRTLVLPRANAREASAIAGLEVLGAEHLRDVVSHLRGEHRLGDRPPPPPRSGPPPDAGALAQIRGQPRAKRVLEIAAAGAHNLLLEGPPGAGKTLLARALPTLLPPLAEREAVEVTRVHSAAGLLPAGGSLLERRPFRAPHHSISDAGLVGGGRPPRPGEVSLAHRGVLFLDELPEFRRPALESLRQPLEEGSVLIARARASVRFPSRVQLVAAMNPCPCGLRGATATPCPCSQEAVRRYRSRISGPLLDRMDLFLWVPRADLRALAQSAAPDAEATTRAAVATARARQCARFEGEGRVLVNAHMGIADLERHVRLPPPVRALLLEAAQRLALSARAYHRVLKVARTIADLDDADTVDAPHVTEALAYRPLPA